MNIDAAASLKTANNDLTALKGNPAGKIKELFATPNRPLPITIIAWLGALGVVSGVFGVVLMLGAGHPIAAIISALFLVVNAACCIGFFGMRKWAVHLFVVVQVLGLVNMLVAGMLSIFSLIITGIIVAICAKYYPKMT